MGLKTFLRSGKGHQRPVQVCVRTFAQETARWCEDSEMKLPSKSKTWTRLFSRSHTITLSPSLPDTQSASNHALVRSFKAAKIHRKEENNKAPRRRKTRRQT